MEIKAVNLRNGKTLGIKIEANGGDSTVVNVYSHSMEAASDVIQSLLADHLKVTEALSGIMFPADFAELSKILDTIK